MASLAFSQKLKELRLKAGFTQKQVYEHFKIPQSTFSSWEVGKSEPSGDMLIKLCEYYKCDMMKEFSSPCEDSVSHIELQLIKKYRELDARGKETVEFILDREYNLAAQAANTTQKQPVNDRERELEEFRANWKREREKQKKSVPAKEKTV